MNTSDLAVAVSKELNVSKDVGRLLVKSVLNKITKTVQAGEKVSLNGFGCFVRVDRAARTGRNPQTGEEIKIVAKRVPKFRPSRSFGTTPRKKRSVK